MARISGRPKIDVEVVLVLSKEEAAAMDALAGYGTDAFLNVFYEKMGRAYLEPHEAALRNLFLVIRDKFPAILERLHRAEKAFEGGKTKCLMGEE